ncbi:MAG: ATP-binding protein [Planctomycetota bacterium]|nr:ATP-binding protein [Planctomycetota bacterium]
MNLPGEKTGTRVPRREVVHADWLIKLRWVAVTGQFLTILVVDSILQIRLELLSLAVLLSVTAVSNFLLELWHRRFLRTHGNEMAAGEINFILGLVMTLDQLSLTSLLYWTGGPTNPFCFFFFVNLSLSAFVLTGAWPWSLNVLSVLCFFLLLYTHVPVASLEVGKAFEPIRSSGRTSLPQLGTLMAFATCSAVIVYFVTRLTSENRKQAEGLRKAEAREAQTEKLQALGTLAAGAAHELSTPLSTISVVINEVEQLLLSESASSEIREDVVLIQDELDRCRGILTKMSAEAGQTAGELTRAMSVGMLADYVIAELPIRLKYELVLSEADAAEELVVPPKGIAIAIGGIIKNAFDAQIGSAEESIRITIGVSQRSRKRELVWQVQDQGEGMTPDVLKRVREPFFTTKEPGQGMGLGVFLAHSTIERLGGSLKFDSEPGVGTTATIYLPMN